jgi:hypothetical protein
MTDDIITDCFFNVENEIYKTIREHWIICDKIILNEDQSVDVLGNVKFPASSSYLLQLPLVFNKVTGDFDCSKLKLTTLKGSPIAVAGTFDCSYNNLTSLEYAPKSANVFIFDNMITSLYNNGINSNYNQVYMLFRTDSPIGLPRKITDNAQHIAIILKYQNYYDVWKEDESFHEKNFDILLEDIREGLQ